MYVDQRLEWLRAPRVVPARCDRRRVDVLTDDRHRAITEKRRPPRHKLVQHRPERVQVRARAHIAAERLLRRHIGHRADHQALLRQTRAVLRQREPEITDLRHAILGQPDIARLQIAVHQLLLVRKLEPPTDRNRDPDRLIERNTLGRVLDQSLHVAATHQLRHHERLPGLLAQVEHRDDMRMRTQTPHRLRFPRNTSPRRLIQTLRLDQRKRNIPIKQQIMSQVNHLLTALAQKPLDHVPPPGKRSRLGRGDNRCVGLI